MKIGKSTEIGNKIDIAIWICHHPKSGRNEARINIYRKRATTSLSYQMNGIWLFHLFFLFRSSNPNTHSPNITFAIPHQQKSKEEEKKRKKKYFIENFASLPLMNRLKFYWNFIILDLDFDLNFHPNIYERSKCISMAFRR